MRALADEFTSAFGGCMIVRGLDGKYLSKFGQVIDDRITLIYTDTPFDFQIHLKSLSLYTDRLRESAFRSLKEETVLVVAWPLYHSE